MPLHDLQRLSDEATVWVFGISPRLADDSVLLPRVDQFLRDWTAHNVPVDAAREVRDGRFLIIAAEKNAETSGCSIDRMFGLVREVERQFGVAILDASRVFYRDASGTIADAQRNAFADVANDETLVFDTTVTTLGEVRSGRWEKRARDSWHKALLRRSA